MSKPGRKNGVIRHQARTLSRELGRPFTAIEFRARFPLKGRDVHRVLAHCVRRGHLAIARREPIAGSRTRSHFVPVLTPERDGQ